MGKVERSGGASFDKPDATGRSRGKRSNKRAKYLRPPKDVAWAWVTDELLNSPAWRAQSVNCRKLIDFLMLEHCRHAGQENGNLLAPYDQLTAYGLSRKCIFAAIREAEQLGLIRCRHGGRYNGSNKPNVYRLTWIGTLDEPPCNAWEAITNDDVRRIRKRGQKKVCTPISCTEVSRSSRGLRWHGRL